ncbi:hypothetical protein BV000_01798B, partial [Haemophilus influenzae]
ESTWFRIFISYFDGFTYLCGFC